MMVNILILEKFEAISYQSPPNGFDEHHKSLSFKVIRKYLNSYLNCILRTSSQLNKIILRLTIAYMSQFKVKQAIKFKYLTCFRYGKFQIRFVIAVLKRWWFLFFNVQLYLL